MKCYILLVFNRVLHVHVLMEMDQVWDSPSIVTHTIALTTTEQPPDNTSQSEFEWNFKNNTSESGSGLKGVIIAAVLWIIFILALTGNLLVLAFGISRKAYAQRTQKVFTCSLAVSDLSMTLLVTWCMAHAQYMRTWAFSSSWCKVYNFVSSLCGHASIGTMMIVSIER